MLQKSLLLFSRSVMSNSLLPNGLQPSRLLCPWDFPGRNTGVGYHSLLQGIFHTPGIEPKFPMSSALAGRFFTYMPPGKPPPHLGRDVPQQNHLGTSCPSSRDPHIQPSPQVPIPSRGRQGSGAQHTKPEAQPLSWPSVWARACVPLHAALPLGPDPTMSGRPLRSDVSKDSSAQRMDTCPCAHDLPLVSRCSPPL